ncbi:MAG: ATP-binding protein [Bacteroidota bacterium]
MKEYQYRDKKSLKLVKGANADWKALAQDCVCFANAHGGKILIGIEDHASEPPPEQEIDDLLPGKIHQQIINRTINVGVQCSIQTSKNGGEYIELIILPSKSSIASTTKGKYYIRVNDECKPVLPDQLTRLFTDKPAFIWELQSYVDAPLEDADEEKLFTFASDIKKSERVSDFVKQKNHQELLSYYEMLDDDGGLNNLGILWVGKRKHRSRLKYSPSVQFIKWDEKGHKVNKIVWDDFRLNPKELIEDIWSKVPDWKEGIEIPDGIFRKRIASYEEVVVRELLANALVHRPYNTAGDIFINLYPNRLEIHNPGLLPIGVTPSNILHKSVQRNRHLARIFYDLKLMEKEGSGYDKIYESLLSSGKALPVVNEGDDRVSVTVKKRVINKEIINFIDKANNHFELNTKELISLGVIAQHKSLTAIEFSKKLGLNENYNLNDWLGRLRKLDLIETEGRTKGKKYLVNRKYLKELDFQGKTNLRNIEPHRLRELLYEDLKTYGKSSIGEIHQRVGPEIRKRSIRYELKKLIESNRITKEGKKKGTKYFIDKNGPKKS